MSEEQTFKNVYMVNHGSRMKDSFFKLEPNINVYMKCSDTLTHSNPFINSIFIKFLLKGLNIEYLDKIIKKIESTKILDYEKITYNNTYKEILKSLELYKKVIIIRLKKLLEKNEEKIHKLEILEQKIKDEDKSDIKMKVIELIQKLVISNYKINDVIENVLKDSDNYEKFEIIKSIHKPSYDILEKYKKIKVKFEKTKGKMEKRYLNYNKYFDYCVFSGNLDHNVRKYTHGILCSNKKMDINICPNIRFSAEDGKGFRDFICEQGVHMEIKKNDQTYIDHEKIIKIIDNYIMGVFNRKKTDVDMINNELNMIIYKDMKFLKEFYFTQIEYIGKNLDFKRTEMSFWIDRLRRANSESTRNFYEKEIKKIAKWIKEHEKIIEKYKYFYKNDYEWSIDNRDKLFYPFGKWSDCNVKEEFPTVVNDFMKQGTFCNWFQYYDPVKRRLLSKEECEKRCKKERNKYVKYNEISLRDVLVYLYFYYNMHKDPSIRLELTLTACKGKFDIVKGVYNTCKLSLSDYIHRKFNINGKSMTLREYDVNKNVEDKEISKKRVKRSCSTILKKHGCPSHCEMPKDESRSTCIVKSRRRKAKK